MTRTIAMRSLALLLLLQGGASFSQPALEELLSLQAARKDLYRKVSPGVVSVEIVRRSLPAVQISMLEVWANQCRLQPWRCGSMSDQESAQWRDWFDSFYNDLEAELLKADDTRPEGDLMLKESLTSILVRWAAGARNLTNAESTEQFEKFLGVMMDQVSALAAQLEKVHIGSIKPVPVAQNTGFVVDKGLVVTTNDIIRNQRPIDQLRIWSEALVGYSTGEVIGQDAETNIALIRLASPGAELSPTLLLSATNEGCVGDFVHAFWHAFNQPVSMRSGEITGTLRQVPFFHCATFLETSFPTSPGTLGAPLVDLHGNLVGMGAVYMAQGSMSEVTFALPASLLLPIVDQLKTRGVVNRGRLGVFVGETCCETADKRKVYVRQIEPHSAAERFGLQVGDVIVSINNEPIHCKMHLFTSISKHKPEEQIVLRIDRKGEATQIALNLDPATQQ